MAPRLQTTVLAMVVVWVVVLVQLWHPASLRAASAPGHGDGGGGSGGGHDPAVALARPPPPPPVSADHSRLISQAMEESRLAQEALLAARSHVLPSLVLSHSPGGGMPAVAMGGGGGSFFRPPPPPPPPPPPLTPNPGYESVPELPASMHRGGDNEAGGDDHHMGLHEEPPAASAPLHVRTTPTERAVVSPRADDSPNQAPPAASAVAAKELGVDLDNTKTPVRSSASFGIGSLAAVLTHSPDSLYAAMLQHRAHALEGTIDQCEEMAIDDGFGVVERKDVASAVDLRHIANADLCVVKLACQHSAACAGFVWNPTTSSAVLKTSVATAHWLEPDPSQAAQAAKAGAKAKADAVNEERRAARRAKKKAAAGGRYGWWGGAADTAADATTAAAAYAAAHAAAHAGTADSVLSLVSPKHTRACSAHALCVKRARSRSRSRSCSRSRSHSRSHSHPMGDGRSRAHPARSSQTSVRNAHRPATTLPTSAPP